MQLGKQLKIMMVLVCTLSVLQYAKAQTSPNNKGLKICAWLDSLLLQLNRYYYLPALNDSVNIQTLKMYIGNITWLHNNRAIDSATNTYYLVDFSNPNSTNLPVNIPNEANEIQFTLGVDSATHYIGIQQGDLDPRKGMYWTWHSGYIHVKMEGICNKLDTRKNKFEFHLGGFEHPYNVVKTIKLSIPNHARHELRLNCAAFLIQSQVYNKPNIMTPSHEAAMLMQQLSTCFYVY